MEISESEDLYSVSNCLCFWPVLFSQISRRYTRLRARAVCLPSSLLALAFSAS